MPKREAVFVMVFSMLRVSEPRKQSVFFKSTFSPCIGQPPARSILRSYILSQCFPNTYGMPYRTYSLYKYRIFNALLFAPEFPMAASVAIIIFIMMTEFLLFAGVTFLQLVIGIIASLTKLTKKDASTFPLNLTRGGWALMIAFVLCFGLSLALFQSSISEKEQLITDSQLRDSINKKHIDSIHYETEKLLAQYGLKVDSSKENIIKLLRDSLKKETYYIAEKNPVLSFCNEGIVFKSYQDDVAEFNLNFCNNFSTAKNINLKYYCVVNDFGKYNLAENEINGFSNSILLPDEPASLSVKIDGFRGINQFFFIAIGTYYNSDLTKKFTVQEILAYTVNSNRVGRVVGKYESEIYNYIASKGIKINKDIR